MARDPDCDTSDVQRSPRRPFGHGEASPGGRNETPQPKTSCPPASEAPCQLARCWPVRREHRCGSLPGPPRGWAGRRATCSAPDGRLTGAISLAGLFQAAFFSRIGLVGLPLDRRHRETAEKTKSGKRCLLAAPARLATQTQPCSKLAKCIHQSFSQGCNDVCLPRLRRRRTREQTWRGVEFWFISESSLF